MDTPFFKDDLTTLYHGDCRDFLPELGRFGLVLTDPPYGVTYQSNWTPAKKSKPVHNDGARLSIALYRSVIPMIQADHVLWTTRWDAWPDVWAILGQWFPLRGLLIWDKRSNGMGDLGHWGPSYEMIASAGNGRTVGSRDPSVIRLPGVAPGQRVHPTEKPVELMKYLIEKLAPASVLDPFAGSGPTLQAARELGIPAVGIEIDHTYCKKIVDRLLEPSVA